MQSDGTNEAFLIFDFVSFSFGRKRPVFKRKEERVLSLKEKSDLCVIELL